jgi:hypothetical protein
MLLLACKASPLIAIVETPAKLSCSRFCTSFPALLAIFKHLICPTSYVSPTPSHPRAGKAMLRASTPPCRQPLPTCRHPPTPARNYLCASTPTCRHTPVPTHHYADSKACRHAFLNVLATEVCQHSLGLSPAHTCAVTPRTVTPFLRAVALACRHTPLLSRFYLHACIPSCQHASVPSLPYTGSSRRNKTDDGARIGSCLAVYRQAI